MEKSLKDPPAASDSLGKYHPATRGLEIKRVPIESLHLDPSNARLHGPENLEAIEGSLRRFGQAEPLVVQAGTGRVIGGNGRLVAMKKLGWGECEVVELEIDDLQATALGIALNRTAELAQWDEPALAKILEELRAEDAMDGIGYSAGDIDKLLAELGHELEAGDVDPDQVPEPPEEAVTRPGDLWILGNHRLLCGDSAKPEDVDRLLAGAPVHLVNTDPPYNVRVEPRSNNAIASGLSSFRQTHHQKLDLERHPEKSIPTTRRLRPKDRPLENDFVDEEEYNRMLYAWFGNIARVLLPGRAFYIWGGYANCANYPKPMSDCGLYFSQSIIWVKEHPVLTRKDFMGNHEWCQPAGTKVLTPEGNVPIESLRDGDRVVSYSRHYNAMIGVRSGEQVHRASRPYSGPLLGVHVSGTTTWCTPGHLWTVRLTEEAGGMWCVYLMRKGDWWRVGKSKLITTWGFGLEQRLYTENAEEAWILSIHPTSLDAALTEQIILAEYGIPLVTWSESAASMRTIADVRMLYDRLDLARLKEGALRALSEHGRVLEYPLLTNERTHVKVSRRVSTMVRACNLLPGVMTVPRPAHGLAIRWDLVNAIDRQAFDGNVYSMDVDRFGHYVADGIVTHNCFYGWRAGAAHKWFGPNNAVDVWPVKKVNPRSMIHLTEKAVELSTRAMGYSSLTGENVLDLFGGSGSTLIGAEQMRRKAFLMEIDPLYCDVIVRRWEDFSRRKAVQEESGKTFEELARDRQSQEARP